MINTKRIKLFLTIGMALCAVLFAGCTKDRQTSTAVIELEGNPTTCYTWVYTMSQENIIREVSETFVQNQNDDRAVGVGGKFIFSFEPVTEGETTLVFSYLRVWEEDIPAIQTVTYRATVDSQNNLTLSQE